MNRAGVVLVQIARTEGSAPREAGAWMVIEAASPAGADGRVIGTIGGGHLEFEAIAHARALLAGAPASGELQRIALGPSLGQCCGGVVWLRYEWLNEDEASRLAQRLFPGGAPLAPVALFGGGHVGQAIARLLAGLPFALHWIDSREGIFPEDIAANLAAGMSRIRCEHSEPVQSAVRELAPGSAVLIMSFSHAEDLDILAACLLRARQQDDLPYIGLIGSKTKWAAFRHRLEARGFGEADFARVTCPIGVPGITAEFRKQPEVIAVAVAAQLLQQQGQTRPLQK